MIVHAIVLMNSFVENRGYPEILESRQATCTDKNGKRLEVEPARYYMTTEYVCVCCKFWKFDEWPSSGVMLVVRIHC